MREVFTTFLRLGSTSFGGPIAHLAYFRRTFVEERRWLDEATFARIVAFCSVLPGPTSSQVGMLIGLTRGGPAGAVLAWLGFTAPSAILMTAFAAALGGAERHAVPPSFAGLLAGLFAAAAAVVAQAVVGLAGSLCTDLPTKLIAVAALFVTLALRPYPGLQWASIALGALAGALVLHAPGLRADG
ncbi:MAG: chromate transporter, partial [Candidatus Eremiobacteraeota bacterium]|nr:chromate transporter [Candidatus Eremiobacteraeota bacterium]